MASNVNDTTTTTQFNYDVMEDDDEDWDEEANWSDNSGDSIAHSDNDNQLTRQHPNDMTTTIASTETPMGEMGEDGLNGDNEKVNGEIAGDIDMAGLAELERRDPIGAMSLVRAISDENDEKEGVASRHQPNMADSAPLYRCWVCPVCESPNSILYTLRSGSMRCINECKAGEYHPAKSAICYTKYPQLEPFKEGMCAAIDANGANDNDNNNNNGVPVDANDPASFPEPTTRAELGLYVVWECPRCGHVNWEGWNTCVMDNCHFPNHNGVISSDRGQEAKPRNPTKEAIALASQPAFPRFDANENNPNHWGGNGNLWNNYNNDNNGNNGNKHYSRYNKYNKQQGTHLRMMGEVMRFWDYPRMETPLTKNGLLLSEPRLVNLLGYPYTNLYHCDGYQAKFEPSNKGKAHGNKSNSNWNDIVIDDDEKAELQCDRIRISFGLGDQESKEKKGFCMNNWRNVAVNPENGWIAVLVTETDTQTGKSCAMVYAVECRGSFGYHLVCAPVNVTRLFVELQKEAAIKNRHGMPAFKEIVEMARVRFVGNSVYVFGWTQVVKKVYHFTVSKSMGWSMVKEYSDDYWISANVMDMDVIRFEDERRADLLVVLFGHWVGYYKMVERRQKGGNGRMEYDLEWFHACAFAKQLTGRFGDVESHSFEAISFDHTQEEDIMENDMFGVDNLAIERQLAAINAHRNKDDSLNGVRIALGQSKDDEKEERVGTINYSNINFCKSSMKSDFNFSTKRFERRSHRYYNYIHCHNEIISHHPSNANFEFMKCAEKVSPGRTLYTVSKQYGVFCTNSTKSQVFISESDGVNVGKRQVFQVSNENQHIVNLLYDDSFGCSGRLLIYIEDESDNSYFMESMTNSQDFEALEDQIDLFEQSQSQQQITSDDNDDDERVKDRTKFCLIVYGYCYGVEYLAKYYNVAIQMAVAN